MTLPERQVRPPTSDDLERAWATVHAVLEPTPLVPSPIASDSYLKLETFQPTGSFKVRGGLAAISALSKDRRAVTASAGNHGLGIAWASSRLGRQATVVVPENSSPPKVEALRTYPIELIEYGSDYEAAEKRALEIGASPGALFISPYNDPNVIAGQATIGRELDSQLPGEVTVIAPVGGGGLLSGYAYGHDHARACTSSASSQTSRVECPPQSPPGGSSACPWARPSQTGLQQISSRAPSRLVSWLPPSLSPLTTTSFAPRCAGSSPVTASSQKARGGCGRGRAQPQGGDTRPARRRRNGP